MSRRLAALLLALIFSSSGQGSGAGWVLPVCAEADRLPFSHQGGTGLYNEIARVIADALGADLEFVWIEGTGSESARRDLLNAGACDLVIGVSELADGYLTSNILFRSPFVILTRVGENEDLSLEDIETFAGLKVGVLGAPAVAVSHHLERAEIIRLDVEMSLQGEADARYIVDHLIEGDVDAVLVWGPLVAPFLRGIEEIAMKPVSPPVFPPLTILESSVAAGVREGDLALRDQVNVAIARGWDQILAVLEDHMVPVSFLPRPVERLP